MKKYQKYLYVSIFVAVGAVLGLTTATSFANGAPYEAVDKSINACKSDQDGYLRIVSKRMICKKWEKKVQWSGTETAVFRLGTSIDTESSLYSYDSLNSRAILRAVPSDKDGVEGYCLDLPFEPLYSSDGSTAFIAPYLESEGALDDYCGSDSGFEAFVDGRAPGSWFFSE